MFRPFRDVASGRGGVEERRFSGAVGADDNDEGAFVDVEGYALRFAIALPSPSLAGTVEESGLALPADHALERGHEAGLPMMIAPD